MKAQLWIDVRKSGDKQAVLFRLLAEGPIPQASVSLSRTKGGCMTPITSLWEHDSHAPVFQTQADLDAYIKRVETDIGRALTGNGPTVESTFKLLRSW